MNFDSLYAYLIDSTWFFLGSWVIMLVAASLVAFRQDLAKN
ncbi:MAG: hypothetical protein WB952_19250 [Terriglobales bacterium]